MAPTTNTAILGRKSLLYRPSAIESRLERPEVDAHFIRPLAYGQSLSVMRIGRGGLDGGRESHLFRPAPMNSLVNGVGFNPEFALPFRGSQEAPLGADSI